ncbi:5-formyltetrahydrofolate cyclo-ligase [Qipengyuania atrilutea]|uniref:5-formyltetrahydrofolate cyclo-ligase n=1 Tax=Qipengyuania atrilutea TaxID=2744473 RepID=A0A850H0F5_9SPHN|nr:5-formyltetrahydrofolate cyclo-ligase [Actirhodobacter atriluteus]NVD44196.1 5-formyltetrahydrofolate cyclo-ligase [Actirhodobacter atriluteus]
MTKDELRKTLRSARREHVAAQPEGIRALLFLRPPAAILDLIPEGATIGLYRANPHEAPAAHYARFFAERGHSLALPRFLSRGADMHFAAFTEPFGESDLEPGPFGLMQPAAEAAAMIPDVLFVPLVGFTRDGARLGQGGGHYDRWLEAHPDTLAIGLGWDVQAVDDLPLEAHDYALDAVITPTRMYGPFAKETLH